MKKLFLLAAATLFASQNAAATTTCTFLKSSKAWLLQSTCTTDETLVIPNGVTLNGQGFKITALDPPGGNFQGPILTNGGTVANFQNLILRTHSTMADICNPDAGKIIGILINRAASTVSNVNITMNKAAGASVCDEGVAIRAQSVPFDPKRTFVKVTVKGSTLNYNQKTALEIDGNISVRLESNVIKGDTDQNGVPMVRRGIHVANKAKAFILNNEVIRNIQNSPGGGLSYGIYLENAGQSTVQTNTLNYNDVAIVVNGGTKITVRGNIIRSSITDGILLTDYSGVPATANTIWGNDVGKSGMNGIYIQSLQGLTTKNVVKQNLIGGLSGGNGQNGLLVEGTLNKSQQNNSTLNSKSSPGTFKDIANAGAGNLYSQNICTTSTGLPVNCGS